MKYLIAFLMALGLAILSGKVMNPDRWVILTIILFTFFLLGMVSHSIIEHKD